MSDKKQILVESVRKLIYLKVPDEEIILHLKEVGINEMQARKLISLARQPPQSFQKKAPAPKPLEEKPVPKPVPKPAEPKPIPKPSPKKEEHSKLESIRERIFAKSYPIKQAPFPKPNPLLEKPERFVPKPKPVEMAKPKPVEIPKKLVEKKEGKLAPKPVEPISFVKKPEPKPHVDISVLWEKGILSSVEKRLAEIKEIKEDIDAAIATKADEVAEKEIKKIKILFESQQDLFLDKVNAQLEDKSKDIEQLIDQKIVEMREQSRVLQREMADLDKKRSQYKDFLEQADAKMSALEQTKANLVTEMNSELIKEKSQIQEFLDSSDTTTKELAERVNKTLEVGMSAIEGLKSDAEETLNNMVIHRSDKLNEEVKQKLEELKSLRSDWDQRMQEYLREISEMKEVVASGMEEEVKQRIRENVSEEMKKIEMSREAYETQLSQRLNQLDALQQAVRKEFDPEKFRQEMSDLEVFKKQFVSVIEKNVSRFNQEISGINQQGKTIESEINKRIKLIDKKIAELEQFEKTFAKEMGIAVEKSFEKKKHKKPKTAK